MNLVVNLLFLLVSCELTLPGVSIVYYSIYFVSAYVPETKGLTLEEIESEFKLMSKEKKRRNQGAERSRELEALLDGRETE